MAVLDRIETLAPIREKVEAGERLDFEDGVALFESDDLLALGELADLARRLRGGDDRVFFVQNLNLYQTIVCRVKCKFCAFAKTNKQEDAYTLTAAEFVEDAVRQYETSRFTEIHCVNGENPHVDLEFYVDVLRQLRAALPDVHLKFYTASEIHHMSKLSGLSHEEVLRDLKDAGLDSMPGGGAEIFADRVRALIAPGKEHPDDSFDVHDTAHRLGITTQCTMLYGHVETYEERVDHLLRLRAQQDASGGFLSFIPLAFHPENTVFERRGWRHTTGADDLKVIAVSRLLLDNVPHVKAYWIMMGMPLAQVALHFGADDVQGTVVREQIFHAAGATTPTEQKLDELVRFVRDAGRAPVQRDTLYNELRRSACGPPRPDRIREHGAGLLPGRGRVRRGRRRADRPEPGAAGGRVRSGSDLVDRVRAARGAAAASAASLRLVGGRGRLDPARVAGAAGAGQVGCGHARKCHVRRPHAGAPAGGRARAARRGGGREASDRRRGAPERVQ